MDHSDGVPASGLVDLSKFALALLPSSDDQALSYAKELLTKGLQATPCLLQNQRSARAQHA